MMMEILHEGWLIKSPPEKRIWRAKWRKRWFVLKHSGHLPGQYLLEYYTEPTCKKLKGKIDLDQCEQIDAGISLESRKWNYQFTFDIRTPKRVYLLVAETEPEMNKWVEYICSVCGLKMHVEEDTESEQYSMTETIATSVNENEPQPSPALSEPLLVGGNNSSEPCSSEPPESPTNSYIPMSECISGRTPVLNETIFSFDNSNPLENAPPPPGKFNLERGTSGEFYDYPRQIQVPEWDPKLCLPQNAKERESVVASAAPQVNWDTYPRDLEASCGALRNSSVGASFGRLRLSNGRTTSRQQPPDAYENVVLPSSETNVANGGAAAPPRDLLPPKPAHLKDHPAQCYQNLAVRFTKVIVPAPPKSKDVNSYDVPPPPDPLAGASCVDDMYDFPRSVLEDDLNAAPPAPQGALKHVKHAYTNAPAGYMNDNVFSYDAQDVQVYSENYLSMDSQKHSHHPSVVYTDMSGDSSNSNNKSPSVVYSNLPSPVTPLIAGPHRPPPEVNRDLKPHRVVPSAHSRSCSSTSSTDVSSAKSPSPVEHVPPVDRGLKPRRNLEVPEKQNLLSLAPPPVSRLGPKHSFRRPRNPGPSLPSASYHSDRSSSDDEPSSSESSRRNSANEDHQPKFFNSSLVVMYPKDSSEIQYLDLDLDSDLQSPKSHDRASTSTVYKTVDFVKTKAFIEMRQNVEETYRKSQ